ncbi:MAG: hypothetical protein QF750_03175, partial [Prochlorococcaceae cyanobacterium ETNP14_MAG_5]|nr:hypothetical protein [Prochlorococcaceae cyanobacterium ETNP14_MAG_5]
AISINPANEYNYKRRASVSYVIEDYQAALDDINKAISINPSIGIFYNARADIKMELGDNDGAISDYSKAAELGKGND